MPCLPQRSPSLLLVVALASSCANDRAAVSFSKRPALQEEPVVGCGGGALRYLVPERALPALREATAAQLAQEPPYDVESERIPCETCDAHGSVCAYVVIRYRDVHDGRAGQRLRFSSSVVRSSSSWQVQDSERVYDEARLIGGVSFDDARSVLEWAREGALGPGSIDSVASVEDLYEAEAPRRAELRLARIVRVEEGAVAFRYLYVRRAGDDFVVEGERIARVDGPLPPSVRGEEPVEPHAPW